jgi:squalene-associated FAD-dependent desaturase
MKIAIIGGGWAGLAAAVGATQKQHQVTVFEMAPELGGRAHSFRLANGIWLDNGQHILIGAYTQTLNLMETVGVNLSEAFYRIPFTLRYADHTGITLPINQHPMWALLQGLWQAKGWSWHDKFTLLRTVLNWQLQGFHCQKQVTVAQLCHRVSKKVYSDLIEPLCISALNTPPSIASGQVFMKVLQDTLFGVQGSSDMLIPRLPLSQLLPNPAQNWLEKHGGTIKKRTRVTNLQAIREKKWQVQGEEFDGVIVATSASEAARLCQSIAQPRLLEPIKLLAYESIITTYLYSLDTHLPYPLLALRTNQQQPAQFLFNMGVYIPTMQGYFAMVTSCGNNWLDIERDKFEKLVLDQALSIESIRWQTPPRIVKSIKEKKATYASEVNLEKVSTRIQSRLVLAGDYTYIEYPATLESAVISGRKAIEMLGTDSS